MIISFLGLPFFSPLQSCNAANKMPLADLISNNSRFTWSNLCIQPFENDVFLIINTCYWILLRFSLSFSLPLVLILVLSLVGLWTTCGGRREDNHYTMYHIPCGHWASLNLCTSICLFLRLCSRFPLHGVDRWVTRQLNRQRYSCKHENG